MHRLFALGALLILAACDSASPPAGGLTFVHLNDTYRIGAVEDGRAGGFGRVVTTIRELQAEGRDVRVLHGGDFLYPSLESQIWNGMQIVDAFNFMDALAPMYVVGGNHEFDRRTPEHLINAVRASEFDWLGDNYRFATGAEDVDAALHSEFTFEYGDYTIGIFALTLHPDHGGNARDYLPIDIDYVGNAERAIQALEAAGADLIIGLTHLHMADDIAVAALREQHPRFLFIVGGHEHEPEFHAGSATEATVMKGASNARAIWRINVEFDADSMPQIERSALIGLNERIASDSEYDALEARWRGELLERFPFLTARVGEAAVPLDAREVLIRNAESGWGNFVADQMRTGFGRPAPQLAFLNSGTLRIDDIIDGDIRFEDIGRTFGFSSWLRHMTITGADFKALLEAGYRGEGPSKGYFPQVSGFRVCVDRSRPEGQRIVSLQVPTETGWAEIGAAGSYTLVAPDYLYGGGDGYDFSAATKVSRPVSELKYLVLDAIMAAQARNEPVGAPVDPANPRIVILESPDDACFP